MGKLGRIALLLHGLVSIGVFAWALGIYTNKINFKSTKPDTPGVIDKSEETLKDLKAASDRAFTRWSGNLQSLAKLEDQRYPRRDFYQGQLNLVRLGSLTPGGAQVASPVQKLDIDPQTNMLDYTKPIGRPAIDVRLQPRIAAKSIAAYLKDMDSTSASIVAAQDLSAKTLVDRKKLNDEIGGPTEAGNKTKGLRLLILEQEILDDNARSEFEYVDKFVTNGNADFELVRKRKTALMNRVLELQSNQ
jgi:hypothetical protein